MATQRLPCTIAQFPVIYLGIPLSVAKLPKATLQPLVDKVVDRVPTWKGKLMNKSVRLALIKSTLTAISVHIAICIRLPGWVFKALEKIMKAFLWTGTEAISVGKCLIAWAQVQRPKDLGRLDVLNLKLSSQALRLRWLWQQRTQPDNLAALLQDTENKDIQAFFDASITVQVGDGRRVKFWSDAWLHGRSLSQLAPHLTTAVRSKITASRTVAEALTNRRWIRDLTGPLSIPVLMEYLQVRNVTYEITLTPNVLDDIRWRWSSSGELSSRTAYQAFFLGQVAVHEAKELWQVRAPNKCKFLAWLILHGRVWTSDRLHQHGLNDNDSCALCAQEAETMDHLFLTCVYSRETWFKVLRRFH